MDVSKLAAALVVLGNAILAAVIGVAELGWTDPEKGAAFLVVNTTVGIGVAIYAHVKPGTSGEPVAIGVTFIAWTESVFGAVVAFDAFELTAEKVTLLQGVIISAVALLTLLLVRERVTPVEDAEAKIRVAMDSGRRMPPDAHR